MTCQALDFTSLETEHQKYLILYPRVERIDFYYLGFPKAATVSDHFCSQFRVYGKKGPLHFLIKEECGLFSVNRSYLWSITHFLRGL